MTETRLESKKAIAAPDKKTLSIREHLQGDMLRDKIAKALPKHMSAERMISVALTALNRVPKLADCTQSSFFRCLLELSAWGLEPDGRRCHLIPYGNECTLILDYKGIVELCFRSGFVKSIHCDVIREHDTFEMNIGEVIRHVPWSWRRDDKPATSGDIIGAYCIVKLTDGASHHEVMTRVEIDGIRNRSKAGHAGPWLSDFSEMAKKTVFRRASKWLPLSAEVRDAFEADAETSLAATKPMHKKVEAVDITNLFEE